MLSIQDIHMSFGGLRAVDGCTFDVAAGSITGLIGPNGAGKTTLFSIIAGFLKPTAGRVLLDGQDVTGQPSHRLFHRGLVRTFQIPHEFNGLTSLENLMTVPAGQDGERLFKAWFAPAAVAAREAEVMAEADETLAFLGLDPVRNELAGNLSGGQKKLLELGRAMMSGASVVLLDEPGAGINPTLLGQLAEMIQRLNRERGITFCIIEHNMDMIARLCDPVIVMAAGSVLTSGAMADIRKDPRVLEAYLGTAAAGDAA
ncbi:MAG: ABC transporter ATP-binding protein [Alphaproteobacteria bacterium]|nr:ABC transporter ATP-binding protein [Alphaproteobacteria bacterium]MDP6565971.1 ABC transporter ATP-binding protein [Alphaproteobacteria bacterium]MDP6813901.1 ABC transporter ATP-binding protein [Alphaproteobacteria bacterium]